MLTLLTVIIALICLLLMGAVLIQNPKGGGLDSTFGGTAGANKMLGAAKTTDLIEKITWALAIALFALCLITSLAVGTGSGGSGVPGSKTTEPGGELFISPDQEILQEDTYLFKG